MYNILNAILSIQIALILIFHMGDEKTFNTELPQHHLRVFGQFQPRHWLGLFQIPRYPLLLCKVCI